MFLGDSPMYYPSLNEDMCKRPVDFLIYIILFRADSETCFEIFAYKRDFALAGRFVAFPIARGRLLQQGDKRLVIQTRIVPDINRNDMLEKYTYFALVGRMLMLSFLRRAGNNP